MNDKALYQLERAIDALTEMAKYLREDTLSQNTANIGTVFSDQDSRLIAGFDNLDKSQNSKWKKEGEMNNTPFIWDNTVEFVPATVSE